MHFCRNTQNYFAKLMRPIKTHFCMKISNRVFQPAPH
nr:MAG TPA: hypothetical protein [Bacteriophage sp.]DAT92324.1 MAG TPA: hypothetical protein [Caudoviricetes sp.]